ncbi:hypothetical protein O181_038135 [Austropuccinia psidii MF-1]|uniref:Uncharacterized protein n=1 Tax=Austropuccinia psidii MF-1 TaxID=1389203 RepID=A0A9Q3D9C1_9BASI|nr:hypothetical protein [Austropuccinia psidii MF-1]
MISPIPPRIEFSTLPLRPSSNGNLTPKLEQSDYPAQLKMAIVRGPLSLGLSSPMGFKWQSMFSFSSLTHFVSCKNPEASSPPTEQNPPTFP